MLGNGKFGTGIVVKARVKKGFPVVQGKIVGKKARYARNPRYWIIPDRIDGKFVKDAQKTEMCFAEEQILHKVLVPAEC